MATEGTSPFEMPETLPELRVHYAVWKRNLEEFSRPCKASDFPPFGYRYALSR